MSTYLHKGLNSISFNEIEKYLQLPKFHEIAKAQTEERKGPVCIDGKNQKQVVTYKAKARTMQYRHIFKHIIGKYATIRIAPLEEDGSNPFAQSINFTHLMAILAATEDKGEGHGWHQILLKNATATSYVYISLDATCCRSANSS